MSELTPKAGTDADLHAKIADYVLDTLDWRTPGDYGRMLRDEVNELTAGILRIVEDQRHE